MKKLLQGLVGLFALVGILAAGTAVYIGWGPFARPVPISKVLADANGLNGKEVLVRAKVGLAGDVLNQGAYEINDGTGSIWVHTQNGAPQEGETITVDARVTKLLQLPGGLERMFGMRQPQLVALEEIRRR